MNEILDVQNLKLRATMLSDMYYVTKKAGS